MCFVTKLAGFEYTEYIRLKDQGEIPVVRAQNVRMNKLDINNVKFIDLDVSKSLERSALTKKALLMTFIGAGIGDVAVFDFEQRWHLAPNVAKLEPFNNYGEKIDIRYLLLFLMSKTGRDEIFKHRKSTAQPSLSMETIRDINVVIPPLAEQKRIVKKVDELMGLCDRLSSAKQTRDNLRQKLRESAIASLMNAETNEELDAAWAFIRDNWQNLSQNPEDVKDLRQSVLELAVRGKLVPQNPEDECASVLIEKIKTEKHSQGIKTLNLSTIAIDAISKDIPQGWATEYLINLVLDFQNGISKRNSNKGELIPVLRLADIKNGQLSEASLREIALTSDEVNKYRVVNGDILVIRVNGSANLVGQFIPCFTKGDWAYSDHLIRARLPLKFINQKYLCIFSKTTRARTHIAGKTITTAGQKTVNQNGLSSLRVLVPPLAEQKRIVAKVDELMQLCDQLEASLRQSQQWAESLAASAISHLTI